MKRKRDAKYKCLKAGSQYDALQCVASRCVALRRVASMRHIVNMLGYKLFTRRTATHRNARLD